MMAAERIMRIGLSLSHLVAINAATKMSRAAGTDCGNQALFGWRSGGGAV